MSSLPELHAQLKRASSSPNATSPKELASTGKLLTQAKIGLTEAGLLIPIGVSDVQQLAAARDILEYGALHAIRSKDVPAFERYIGLLQPFWVDNAARLPPSPHHTALLALLLLLHLSQNRIAAFHVLLETLSPELLSHPDIQSPVKMERWLMEGSYSKVWEARGEVEKAGQWLWEALMNTIRNEIASCEEKAYTTLPLSDAATLLFFTSPAELSTFAQTRGWSISPTTQQIAFRPRDATAAGAEGAAKQRIPRENMIRHSLVYARELESIV